MAFGHARAGSGGGIASGEGKGGSGGPLNTPPLLSSAATSAVQSMTKDELVNLTVKVTKRLQAMEKKLKAVAQSRASLAVGIEAIVSLAAVLCHDSACFNGCAVSGSQVRAVRESAGVNLLKAGDIANGVVDVETVTALFRARDIEKFAEADASKTAFDAQISRCGVGGVCVAGAFFKVVCCCDALCLVSHVTSVCATCVCRLTTEMARQRAAQAAALSDVTTQLQAAQARVTVLEQSGAKSAVDEVAAAKCVDRSCGCGCGCPPGHRFLCAR